MYYFLSFIAGVALAALVGWLYFRRYIQWARKKQQNLLDRARRAEKMAELGDLTSNLAHEIRNPLSIIKINLQLLSEDISHFMKDAQMPDGFDFSKIDDPERKFRRQLRKLETVTGEANRLADTLTDFMKYAGRMELHPARNDINQLLDELVDFYEPQALAKNVQLRSSLSHTSAFCRVDADHFKQAILNLFINATQAMSETGGELIIRSTSRDAEIYIEIIDTGPGIPPEQAEKIFNPYFTTRSGGTGLGLPTCRRIIEEHQGHIDLHSEPGKGTSFTIVLPLIND